MNWFHRNVFGLGEVITRLTRIEALLQEIKKQETKEMAALDDLAEQVAATTTVEQSAITLINGLAQQLAAAIASGNPAALAALQTQLKTSADALASAITANTPSAPPPTP